MHFDVLVVVPVFATDVAIDDLVILDVDVLVVIGGVKTDIHAARGDIVDEELVVAQVEITRCALVFA